MANTPHFERDVAAGSALAAQFGSGAGTAEQLIEANSLRFSQELVAANSLNVDREATAELDRADVAKSAGVEEKNLLDVAVRGGFITYVAQDPQGRVYKGVLDHESGEAPEVGNDPARARIAAQADAAAEIAKAQEKAAQIVRDAEAKAAELVAKAAQGGQERVSSAQQDAAEAQQQEQGEQAGSDPTADQRSETETGAEKKAAGRGKPKG